MCNNVKIENKTICLNVHNLLNNVILKNQKRHLCYQFRNYNIDTIDNIDGALDCFKITFF